MSGQSMTEAASGAGVRRATLYKWLNNDAHFRAVHNAWKRDTMAAAHSSVLALTEPALRAVAGALDAGDAKIRPASARRFVQLTPSGSSRRALRGRVLCCRHKRLISHRSRHLPLKMSDG